MIPFSTFEYFAHTFFVPFHFYDSSPEMFRLQKKKKKSLFLTTDNKELAKNVHHLPHPR